MIFVQTILVSINLFWEDAKLNAKNNDRYLLLFASPGVTVEFES